MAQSAAGRRVVPTLGPAATGKHASSAGLFGLRMIPGAGGALMPVALLVLIGALIAALAFADSVGIGPRHLEWRQRCVHRLAHSSRRFTFEAAGAATRVGVSLRRLEARARRLWSRRHPLSR